MTVDYTRRGPKRRAAPQPAPAADPEPAPEPDGPPEPREPLMPATQVASVLALCVSAGLTWFHLTGWAWLAGAVALLLSRRFWGVVRFIAAYQALRVVRAVSVRTARRRGELHGRAGSVTDPAAPWRVWLERD